MGMVNEVGVATGQLRWLDLREQEKPRSRFAATAYRPEHGINDLFSVWIVLPKKAVQASVIDGIKVHAATRSMEERLPARGGRLIITDGFRAIAEFRCQELDTSPGA